MKVFPSTSVTVAPFAFAMNRGVPPTERKARTGEFTPPGITFFAARKSLCDFVVENPPTRFASRECSFCKMKKGKRISRILSGRRLGVKEEHPPEKAADFSMGAK